MRHRSGYDGSCAGAERRRNRQNELNQHGSCRATGQGEHFLAAADILDPGHRRNAGPSPVQHRGSGVRGSRGRTTGDRRNDARLPLHAGSDGVQHADRVRCGCARIDPFGREATRRGRTRAWACGDPPPVGSHPVDSRGIGVAGPVVEGRGRQ